MCLFIFYKSKRYPISQQNTHITKMLKQLIGCSISTTLACLYSFYIGSSTTKVSGLPSLWIVIAIIHLIQLVFYIPAMLFKTEKFYDLVGGMSFVVGAILCLSFKEGELTTREMVGMAMMNLWASRMALFLFYRIMKVGEDTRFRDIKIDAWKFLGAWWIQALWISVTAGPVYTMILNKSKVDQFGIKEIVGTGLFVFGFLLEVVADQQKLAYKLNPKTKDQFITHGLWKFSRHPNFIGDILVWLGLSIYCLDSLSGYERYASLISPIFTYVLLTKVSGVDMLEEHGDKKWGGIPAYEQYKRTTPILFPGMGVGSNVKSKQK